MPLEEQAANLLAVVALLRSEGVPERILLPWEKGVKMCLAPFSDDRTRAVFLFDLQFQMEGFCRGFPKYAPGAWHIHQGRQAVVH